MWVNPVFHWEPVDITRTSPGEVSPECDVLVKALKYAVLSKAGTECEAFNPWICSRLDGCIRAHAFKD